MSNYSTNDSVPPPECWFCGRATTATDSTIIRPSALGWSQARLHRVCETAYVDMMAKNEVARLREIVRSVPRTPRSEP